MKIFTYQDLLKFNNVHSLIHQIEKGFVAYSQGNVQMPPVAHMHFPSAPGDLHIKCAAKPNEEFYVVKIASCFPENSRMALPSIQGMMLLFSQQTGEPIALFKDDGYLTHLRTAVAGAICAKYFAPKNLPAIGIIGAGMQAMFQLDLLRTITSCRQVWMWAPNRQQMKRYQEEEKFQDFTIHLAQSPQEVAKHSRLIITTTPASTPFLFAQDIYPGTHLTAVGSDRPGKQELDTSVLELANRVIVDSKAQCFQYGETFCALQEGKIAKNQVDEIGEVILGLKPARMTDEEITISDLTGLGIQDLQIATMFYQFLNQKP